MTPLHGNLLAPLHKRVPTRKVGERNTHEQPPHTHIHEGPGNRVLPRVSIGAARADEHPTRRPPRAPCSAPPRLMNPAELDQPPLRPTGRFPGEHRVPPTRGRGGATAHPAPSKQPPRPRVRDSRCSPSFSGVSPPPRLTSPPAGSSATGLLGSSFPPPPSSSSSDRSWPSYSKEDGGRRQRSGR